MKIIKILLLLLAFIVPFSSFCTKIHSLNDMDPVPFSIQDLYNIKTPEDVVMSTKNSGWVFFHFLDQDRLQLIPDDDPKEARFEDAYLYEITEDLKREYEWFFADLCRQELRPGITEEDFNIVMEDMRQACAYQYKIHLQVTNEYLIPMAQDLVYFIDTYLENIGSFKVAKWPDFEIHTRKDGRAIATIVIYPVYIPGTKEDKNEVLRPMVNALLERYRNIAADIASDVEPRWNLKVEEDNVVFIAGSAGGRKTFVDNIIKRLKANGKHEVAKSAEKHVQKFYTPGKKFIKNYEYEHAPLIRVI